MKKINQSCDYCEKQISWLKDNLSGKSNNSEKERRSLEIDFFKRFKINRSYQSLRAKAYSLGFRSSFADIKVGETRKKGKKGECDYIVISVKPVRYQRESRYIYEQHHGVKLKSNEVVFMIDGNTKNLDVSNMIIFTRSELLRFNNLSEDIPIETRVLIAKIDNKTAKLEGKGDWTDNEKKWLLNNTKDENDWVSLAGRFNKKFKKKRNNRDLIMMHAVLKNRKKDK